MRSRALGAAAFMAAAAGGAALGWLGERRTLRDETLGADSEWAELRRPLVGRPLTVTSFDGTRLAVELLGPDDPAAPTLVLAHGYGLSQHAWHHQRRDLAGAYRLICYDQRGHARSEPAVTGDYSITALGRDLAAVIDATVPAGRRLVAVGHSMGGMTVLSYVEQHPDDAARRLAGAVLLDTTGSDVIAGGLLPTSVAALSALQSRLVRRAFNALDRGSRYADRAYGASTDLSFLLTRVVGLGPDASPAAVAFTEQMLLDCATSVKAALGPMFTSLDLRAAAPLLTAPCLVVVGSCDRITPPAQARRLAQALPDARLVELAGAGHMTPLEAHAAVTEHVRAFAGRVLGQRNFATHS